MNEAGCWVSLGNVTYGVKGDATLLGSFPIVIREASNVAIPLYSVGNVLSPYISIFNAISSAKALKKYMYAIEAGVLPWSGFDSMSF